MSTGTVPPLPRTPGGTNRFFKAYTQGLTTSELERLFTRETPEAYRFFSQTIDYTEIQKLPWHQRILAYARVSFLAFTMKLSPARRAIYGAALVCMVVGLVELFREVHVLWVPHPAFAPGTLWLLSGFVLVNLLIFVEVADRLTLKNDLEIARGIQQAMLPRGAFHASGVEAFGMTRPANTVGGDFYDIQKLPDGRVLLALGDVAGKGSPASLLMALLLAMMRTLVDEASGGNQRAQLAIDMFCYRIKKYIGAYYAALGHLDAIVFTGGIGENASIVREKICGGLEELGIKLDLQRNNQACHEERRIEAEGGRVAILVIPTDEEGVIAADTYQLATTPK